MALTPVEIQQKYASIFANNTTGDISEADLRDFVKDLTDYLGAAEISDVIPAWAAGLTFQIDATDDGEFCTYTDSGNNIRLWQTKTNDNIGNPPPNTPGVTSNTHWQEVSASSGSAFVEWSPGIYGAGLIIVYYNNALYKLEVATRPFKSVNITTEIGEGKWTIISGGSGSPFLQFGPFAVPVTISENGSFSDLTLAANTNITFAEGGHIEGLAKTILIHTVGGYTFTIVKPTAYNLYYPADFDNGAVLPVGSYQFMFAFFGGAIKISYIQLITEAPTTPLSAVTIDSSTEGDQQVTLFFTNPNGGNEDDNLVQYKLATEPTTWTDGVTAATGATQATQTGLTNNLLYDLRIVARGSGSYSNAIPSNEISDTPENVPISRVALLIEDINKNIIIIQCNKALDNASVPATSDFILGTGKTVSAVAISGTNVNLTISSAYGFADIETLSYIKGTNPIQDTSGTPQELDGFTYQSVTNNIIGTGDIESIGGILAYLNAADIDADGSNNSAYTTGGNITTWSDKGLLGNDATQDASDFPTYDDESIIGFGDPNVFFPSDVANFLFPSDITIARRDGCIVLTVDEIGNTYPLLKNASNYIKAQNATSVLIGGIAPTYPTLSWSGTIAGAIMFINFESDAIRIYRNNEPVAIASSADALNSDLLLRIVGGEGGIPYIGKLRAVVLFNKALNEAQRLNVYDEIKATTKFPLPPIIDPIATIANCQTYIDTFYENQMYLSGSNLVEIQDQRRLRNGAAAGTIVYDSTNKWFDHAAAGSRITFTQISYNANAYTFICAVMPVSGKVLFASGTGAYFWLNGGTIYDSAGQLSTVDGTLPSYSAPWLVTYRGNGSGRIMRVNGAQKRSGAVNSGAQTATSFGSTYTTERFNGKLYAYAFFNRALSDTEITTVEGIINNRHGNIFF